MGRHVLERNFRPHRQLNYGSIRLVPVDNGVYPYTAFPDEWHVPGWRDWATTEQLVDMATRRGITVTLTETSRDGQSTERLN